MNPSSPIEKAYLEYQRSEQALWGLSVVFLGENIIFRVGAPVYIGSEKAPKA
ncbi:MAG: hypothetical protein JSV18_01545 [Candidatus Bathyarchaeota archaeon]|nr:MAG: hypothetical protein JSV18_01545 [Candidatus Bathyarchaeota archaeon]